LQGSDDELGSVVVRVGSASQTLQCATLIYAHDRSVDIDAFKVGVVADVAL
jgi:hypothetical protein